MNNTIDYYNKNAHEYFDNTSRVSLNALYEKFLKYIPAEGKIMDLGCGSGRDVKWFIDNGYDAYGLDASVELVRIAQERYHIPVEVGTIETWIANTPFDGIWCCASLMHLEYGDVEKFFSHIEQNLKPEGVLFVSVKTGIATGVDSFGRYFRNYSETEILEIADRYPVLELKEMWFTSDVLSRETFTWLNAIFMKSKEM